MFSYSVMLAFGFSLAWCCYLIYCFETIEVFELHSYFLPVFTFIIKQAAISLAS